MINIAICCVAKLENNYIREWVEYHLKLGFRKIFIYDNNEIYGEIFQDILSDYIKEEVVVILNARGKSAYQLAAYSDFYNSHGDKFDWIAFIDVDEFVTFSNHGNYSSMCEYLNTIQDFELIHLSWMCFGDNDLTYVTSYKTLERFKKPLNYDININDNYPENFHIKSIVRGGGKSISWTQPHTPIGNFKICNGDGIEIFENLPFHPYTFKTIYIRHFCTKTISEWLLKIDRGNADGNFIYPIEKFFSYNKKTKEKEEIIKQFLFTKYSNEVSLNEEGTVYLPQEKVIYLQKQIYKLTKQIEAIYSSKSYKLGKLLFKPYSIFKKIRHKSENQFYSTLL